VSTETPTTPDHDPYLTREFEEDDYPALYQAANLLSLRGQRSFFRALRLRLAGLILATVSVGTLVALGYHGVGGWIAVGAFGVALVAEAISAATKPDRVWYEGRAAAESVKTLTWRYSVKGESFEDGDPSATDKRFIQRIDEVLHDLGELSLPAPKSAGQISNKMRSVRATDFLARKLTYREARLEDQRSWYQRNADQNSRVANRWTKGLIVVEGLGVLGGIVTASGWIQVDFLSILATVALASTAWIQAKQHRNLAVAYGITAQELDSIKAELDALSNESEWADFVGQSEEAISREHTLWRASRGLRFRPTRR